MFIFFKSSGVTGVLELQEFWSYRSSGVTGVQEFRSSGVTDISIAAYFLSLGKSDGIV